MKKILCLITVAILISCTNNPGTDNTEENNIEQSDTVYQQDEDLNNNPTNDSSAILPVKKETAESLDTFPADGVYRFDMSFAEKKGQSMGEKVTVIIKGESIKLVYEGDGNLKVAKGTVLEEGILMKHKSGVWIIGHDKKDALLDQIGGCSGGLSVIDFKNKKYLTC